MAILGSMKTEPKKQRSKLLRKVRRPPEHSSPRNHLAFTRGPCTVRSVPSTRQTASSSRPVPRPVSTRRGYGRNRTGPVRHQLVRQGAENLHPLEEGAAAPADWWRQLHSFGLRRERGGYDIVAYMEWVQAAVDAEVWPGVSKSSCRRLSMRANQVRKCYLRPMFAARVPVPISSDGSPI